MTDTCGSIAGILGTVHQLAAPVWRQFMHLYNYKANIDNLEKEVGKLKNARDRVERKVDDAKNNIRGIDNDVENWGKEVKQIIHDADLIIKKANNRHTRDEAKHEDVNLDEAEKLNEEKEINPCFMRFRPNLITRYKLSKEASKKEKAIKDLLAEERKFSEFFYEITPPPMWPTSDGGYNAFKSRESTLKSIMDALNNANYNRFGIYGMAGLGKTTLVKEVGKAMEGKPFDKVVFVEVTATPDIKKIQRRVAEHLRLTLPDGSESQRADKLYAALKNNKKSDKENDKKNDEEKDKPLPQESKKTLGRSLSENKLGLKLTNEPDPGRKKMLQHEGLKNDKKNDAENDKKKDGKDEKTNKESDEKNKKFLIILDNIWEELKLDNIGIPSGADFGESKLLLTTRKRDVLVKMGCKAFEIGKLEDKEAWKLFKETAGDIIKQGKLRTLAEGVCKKCGGLPIAIVAAAKALSNSRNPSEWSEALEQFTRSSPENFEDDLKPAYVSIELSYKCLPGEELKKTFLLCSLMGREGSILDLLKYVMGLNIFEDIYTMQKARDRVCKVIRKLKDSCLLLDGQTSESFSMHDFVREVAISIAKRDESVFSVINDTDPWEWPHNDRLKICTKIFIRDSSIIELPEGLECPQLQSFFMNRVSLSSMPASRLKNTNFSYSQDKIPQNFFKGMTKLKVLDLTRMQLSSLRSSLSLLKDLQTLCLDSCKFEDVAIIGELKCLKILSLRGSNVEQLPEEIAQLTKLRLLDLSYCEQLQVIAPNVISSLFRLEELYMSGCSVEWEVEVHNVKSNASLEELKHLSQLTTLELDIEDDKNLPQDLFSKELRRYKISIGDRSSAFDGSNITGDSWQSMEIKSFSFEEQSTFRTLNTLKLKLNSTIYLEELQGFNNVEFLCLDKLEGVQNVLYELNKEGFSQLKHLRVHNNRNLLCIVDTRSCIPHNTFPAFPLLESMFLFNLINLEAICFDPPKERFFQNLTRLIIKGCEKLKYVFPSSLVENIKKLQHLEICNCKVLKEIVGKGGADRANVKFQFPQVTSLKLQDLPELIAFYPEIHTSEWPMLKNLMVRDCEKLQIFTSEYKVVFPDLEVLNLEGVNIEKIWDNQLQTSVSSSYQNLTHVIISDCKKLKYVFPFSMVKSFQKLEHLEIWNCKILEEIVWKGERAKKNAEVQWPMLKKLEVGNCERLDICTPEYKVVFPNLEDLVLYGINIEKIWDSQRQTIMSSFCQNLTSLTIESCEKLKYVFLSSMVKSFKKLQHLEVWNCKVLEEIVSKGEGTDQAIDSFEFPQVTSLKLQYLPELIAFYSGAHTSKWPMLEELEVYNCDKLQIFTSQYKVVFPNLKVLNLEEVNIEKIWNNQLLTSISSSCQNLTSLTIKRCEKLKYVFPSSMVKNFRQLQHIEICNCKVLKELVVKGEGADQGIVKFEFPQVTSLKLQDLPELTAFYPGIHTSEWPMLKNLEVLGCEKLHIFTSEYKAVFYKLEVLDLKGLNMEKIWIQTSVSSFYQNLTHFTIQDCKKLKYVFPSSMVKSFKKLQHLEICDCKVLEEVVLKGEGADQATATFEFPKVTSLKLRDLPELTAFYPGTHTTNWPMLKELEVYKCDKLQIFTSQYKVIFPNLEVLNLEEVNTTKIWDSQLQTIMSSFCQTLTSLTIKRFEKLKYVFQSSMVENFKKLQHLEICNCKVLKEIVVKGEGADQAIVKFEFPQVTSLKLHDLPELTTFYPGMHTSEWPMLKNLEVLDCEKLQIFTSEYKVVFPKLEALYLGGINSEKIRSNQFDQLQRLEIYNCKVLKEIVAKAGEAEAVNKFVFPRVTYLKLNNLPELTTLNISEWPKLENLRVYDCFKVKIFLDDNEGQIDTSNSKSLDGKVDPHLLKVKLSEIDGMMTWQFQFPDNFFSRLKVLEIRDNKSANFPFQRFNKCDESSYTETFFCGEDEKHSVTPTQIKHLELNYLLGLKYMWKQDSKLDSVLQNVEVLKVCCCFKLMNLAPTSASFQNLTALEVYGCHGLINLITSSTAKSLVQLREMEIRECEMMIEVVENERDAAEDEIVFSKLKLLSLKDLESLTCFFSGNCIFNFPSLEELIVAECPNLKTFSRGDLITPILTKVKQEHWDEGCWAGELNRTVQQLRRKVVSSDAEEWTLSGEEITPVWEGQFPENFCKLKVLKIIKDESENIPIGILQRFINLENLILRVSSYKEIFSCGKDEKYAGTLTQIKVLELQGLSNLKYIWKRDSQLDSIIQNLEILKVDCCHNLITLDPSSAYFENLTTLEIWGCDRLINLLSSSTAKSLMRLEEMTVGFSEMMTEVVANEGEVAEEEIVFSKLTSLTLVSLESLTCFYPGKYSINFPSLDELAVYNCPKMRSFSEGELIARNLKEVHYFRTFDDNEDCWKGDLNATIQHLHKQVNIQSS